ncbi:MAG: hypothetical protein M1814_005756 [Vezdaea aestivalis]|nr:MAG: hypothetical protein M1814_005756 [Vezdaea aestivalis]
MLSSFNRLRGAIQGKEPKVKIHQDLQEEHEVTASTPAPATQRPRAKKLNPALFDGVVFALIEEPGIGADYARELISKIEGRGGRHFRARSDIGRFPANEVTHIVSATAAFPAYHDAVENLISVVTPEWVVGSFNSNSSIQTRSYSPDPRLFFSGLTVFIPYPPSQAYPAISDSISAAGGTIATAMSSRVTHIVLMNLDDDVLTDHGKWLNKSNPVEIVVPQWFDDCFKMGRRIDHKPYKALYPQETIDLPEIPTEDIQVLKVFKDKKVKICEDLSLDRYTLETCCSLVLRTGKIVTKVKEADMVICRYRDDQDYIEAICWGVQVGNISWFYNLVTHDRMTSPMRQILHYPFPANGVPGLSQKQIAVSNFGGEARIYLLNLIEAAGARVSRKLNIDTTDFLIAKETKSDKCLAAKECGIHLVNHLWLEESYIRMSAQSPSDPKYSEFSTKKSVNKALGRQEIDQSVIDAVIHGRVQQTLDESFEQPSHQIEEQQLSSQLDQENISPDSSVPSNRQSQGARNPVSTSKSTPLVRRPAKKEHSIAVTPLQQTRFEDKITLSSTASRGAKDRAAAKLHELTDDIALYQKERKRKGGVIWGGKRDSNDLVPIRKRDSSSDESETEAGDDNEHQRRSKKQKRTLPPVQARLLVTGYTKWVGNEAQETTDKRLLRQLGILVVNDPASCTHLAAPSILRTPKFVSAIARAPVIVSTDFIDRCVENQSLPEFEKFLLRDKAWEKQRGFTLKDAISRAQQNRSALLRPFKIYVTQDIKGGVELYRQIIEANGGTCLVFRPRHGSTMDFDFAQELSDDEDIAEGIMYLISGDTENEVKSWERFERMAKIDGQTSRITNSDWLLEAAMRQEVKWVPDRHSNRHLTG